MQLRYQLKNFSKAKAHKGDTMSCQCHPAMDKRPVRFLDASFKYFPWI